MGHSGCPAAPAPKAGSGPSPDRWVPGLFGDVASQCRVGELDAGCENLGEFVRKLVELQFALPLGPLGLCEVRVPDQCGFERREIRLAVSGYLLDGFLDVGARRV